MSGISNDKIEIRRRIQRMKLYAEGWLMGEAWYGIGGDPTWYGEES
jgi:hypothetical protein